MKLRIHSPDGRASSIRITDMDTGQDLDRIESVEIYADAGIGLTRATLKQRLLGGFRVVIDDAIIQTTRVCTYCGATHECQP